MYDSLLYLPCIFPLLRGNVVVVALTVRDCYEAFVVYSFLTLILEHAGGDYNCIEQIKHLPPVRVGLLAVVVGYVWLFLPSLCLACVVCVDHSQQARVSTSMNISLVFLVLPLFPCSVRLPPLIVVGRSRTLSPCAACLECAVTAPSSVCPSKPRCSSWW